MSNRKKFLQATVGGGAAMSAVAAFPNIALGAPEPIRLGAIPPITGANALLGEEGLNGAKLAVATVNARPGKVYGGRPFELVVEDATSENQTSVAALNKLLTENVDAVVLPVLSTQIQAMAPVIKPTGIPWMTGGTAVKNTQLGLTNLFRCRPSDGITAAAMTNFAVKNLGKKNVGIMYSSEAFGTGGDQQVNLALGKLGLKPVVDIAYPIGAKDYTAEFLKMKQANVDVAILYVQNPSDVAIILASYRQLGLTFPLVGSPSMSNHDALATAGKDAEGIYSALDFPPGTPKVNAYIAEFQKTYNKAPDIGTGSGWVNDAILLLADTMAKLKSSDKAKVVEALHAVKGWEGVMGEFECDSEGNMLHAVGIARIEHGAPKLVARVRG